MLRVREHLVKSVLARMAPERLDRPLEERPMERKQDYVLRTVEERGIRFIQL